MDLKPGGEDEVRKEPTFRNLSSNSNAERSLNSICVLFLQTVTMDNAEEYVDLMFDFCMHTGIQKQMEAFRGNFRYGRIYVCI